MWSVRACIEMGWVRGLRYGVDRVWLDLANGKTLEYRWADFGKLYRF